MIEVRNVSQSYSKSNDVLTLDNVNLTVKKNTITALVGANGAGKSTLLGAMSNLIPITKGQILLDGEEVPKLKTKTVAKNIAFLKQSHQINIRLSVNDLVEFGRFPHSGGRLKPLDRQKVSEAIDYMSIGNIRDRYLDQLSGGQRQRAFIAMVLAQDTPYVFLDEPLNNLDIKYSVEMMNILRKLVTELGKTIVVVLHDINFAAAYAGHIVAMKNGKILSEGCPTAMISKNVLDPVFDHDFNIADHDGKRVCLYF
jgi:iron complex transport system ATP-binding protein